MDGNAEVVGRGRRLPKPFLPPTGSRAAASVKPGKTSIPKTVPAPKPPLPVAKVQHVPLHVLGFIRQWVSPVHAIAVSVRV